MKRVLSLLALLLIVSSSALAQNNIEKIKSLPLTDVHAHVLGKDSSAPIEVINMARQEKLERVYLICRAYRNQLPIIRKNKDIARMLMHPPVGKKGWWKNEEAFLLENRDCVSGVKLHPSIDEYVANLDKLEELFASAAKHKFVIVTHTAADSKSNADFFLPLMEKYPTVRLILYHANPVQATINLLKKFTYVYTDISYTSFDEAVQRKIMKEVGADKILFGIDTPLGWPRDEQGVLQEHYRDVVEEISSWFDHDIKALRKIFHENSISLFENN